MIIYSNDPRGVHAAIAEELEKNPNAQIQLKKAKEEKEISDLSKLTKSQLQDQLDAAGISYETDANKQRLIELLEG